MWSRYKSVERPGFWQMSCESGLVPLRESVLLGLTVVIRASNRPWSQAFHDKSVMRSQTLAPGRIPQVSGFKGSFWQGEIFQGGPDIQVVPVARGFLLAKRGESDNSPDNFRIYTKIS